MCIFNGLAGVKKKGKWGFINKQNKTVIPFDYDILKPVHRFKKFYDYNRTLFCNFENELFGIERSYQNDRKTSIIKVNKDLSYKSHINYYLRYYAISQNHNLLGVYFEIFS